MILMDDPVDPKGTTTTAFKENQSFVFFGTSFNCYSHTLFCSLCLPVEVIPESDPGFGGMVEMTTMMIHERIVTIEHCTFSNFHWR